MNRYSIIISVYNEKNLIPDLLKNLDIYIKDNNEIIIIDDGSTDGSYNILKKNKEITLIRMNQNEGKGSAIRKGLKVARENKIIIFDGDLEIHTSEIKKLMILDKENDIVSAMGYRFNYLPLNSVYNIGNYIFTYFYNFLFKTHHKDILCCAKSFYKYLIEDINLKSKKFDIDVELSHFLSSHKSYPEPKEIHIQYKRRNIKEGKKLKVSDGFIIFSRILKLKRNYNSETKGL